MISGRTGWLIALAGSTVLAYSIVRAQAPFDEARPAPVIYSGNLSTSGAPLTGAHQIAMNLWRSADTSVAADEVCTTAPQTIDVTAGNFQIQLDDACIDAFTRHTQLFQQLVVDGTAFPLEQVGSVPYALRSGQAPAGGARLVQEHTATYGADGFRGTKTSGNIRDTKRNEVCVAQQTAPQTDGGAPLSRCLPYTMNAAWATEATGAGWYSDAACSVVLPTAPNIRYYYNAPGGQLYVADVDATKTFITAIYAATSVTTTAYVRGLYGNSCTPVAAGVLQFTVGASIPLDEFVELRTVTE